MQQEQDLNDGKSVEPLTESEQRLLKYYHERLPVVDTDCVMNKICHYIEDVDFHIKQKVKTSQDFDYRTLQTPGFTLNKFIYEPIKQKVEDTMKDWAIMAKKNKENKTDINSTHDNIAIKGNKEVMMANLKNELLALCSNEESLTNHLVYLFYEDKKSLSKSTLWSLVGKQIFENVKQNYNNFYFPVRDKNGDIEFMYEKYSVKKLPLPNNVLQSQSIQENTTTNENTAADKNTTTEENTVIEEMINGGNI